MTPLLTCSITILDFVDQLHFLFHFEVLLLLFSFLLLQDTHLLPQIHNLTTATAAQLSLTELRSRKIQQRRRFFVSHHRRSILFERGLGVVSWRTFKGLNMVALVRLVLVVVLLREILPIVVGADKWLASFLLIGVELRSELGDHREAVVNLLFKLFILIFEQVASGCYLIEFPLSLLVEPHILLLGLSFLSQTGHQGEYLLFLLWRQVIQNSDSLDSRHLNYTKHHTPFFSFRRFCSTMILARTASFSFLMSSTRVSFSFCFLNSAKNWLLISSASLLHSSMVSPAMFKRCTPLNSSCLQELSVSAELSKLEKYSGNFLVFK